MTFKYRWRSGSAAGIQHADSGPVAAAHGHEWPAIVQARANVLIEGSEAAVAALVREWTPALRAPFATWEDVPRVDRPATLLVRRTERLAPDEQDVLLHWLDLPGERVQVIATADAPLFPLVGAGRFSADLYYRLNVIRIDLRERRRPWRGKGLLRFPWQHADGIP